MSKFAVTLYALFSVFASLAAPFTDGGVTYTPNDEVTRRQPVVTGVNVTGMVESVSYTKDEVDRRIATDSPVKSVNGMRGDVKLGAREVGALPDNRAYLETDADFVNAVRNVQVKSGDSERVLPPYLHEMEFDYTYPDYAEWYYRQADYSGAGMCSVRRTGGIVERNFDWKFDYMPEFVVRTAAGGGRFASIGVANVGSLLTEADVSKGWSPYYRCLPGHMVDGINESGVFAEVNVVDGEPDWNNQGGDIHPLGAVRWVLDYGTNAQQAAEALASRIAFPSGWSQNFHYLVADKTSTYIVENGDAHEVTGTAVMTNFKLYPSRDTDGSGQERYDVLSGGEPITNAWWTLAYLRGTSPVRVSDIGTDTNAVFAAWERGDRESHRGQAVGGQTWWQTVHTSIYDITNRVLRVAVQETDDWYVFQVPSAGGVKPEAVREIVKPMIGAATNGLRRVDDFEIRDSVNVLSANFSDVFDGCELVMVSEPYLMSIGLEYDARVIDVTYVTSGGDIDTIRGVASVNYDGYVPPVLQAEYDTFDSFIFPVLNRIRISVSQTYKDRIATTNGVRVVETNLAAKIDAKRDITNNVCAAESFGEWTFSDGVERTFYHIVNNLFSTDKDWDPDYPPWDDVYYGYADSTLSVIGAIYKGEIQTPTGITATRSRVATSNEIFVTESFVTNAVNAAKFTPSAADPAFSNAVLSVSTGISTNDWAAIASVVDWASVIPGGVPGGAGTLGAVLAALAATVLALKKKTSLLKSDGTAEDGFATDLLGKQVAISAVQDIVNDMFDNGDTTAYPRTSVEG